MGREALDPLISDLAAQVRREGEAIGLPLVAACADISSARPVAFSDGMPIAAFFDFTEVGKSYWTQGDLAVRNAIVAIARWTAEPFYYDRGTISGWRPLDIDPALLRQADEVSFDVKSAIICPIHLPGSVIGAVIWATDQDGCDVSGVFDRQAAALHILALRFIAACDHAAHGQKRIISYRLTRREIQCLKLAAAGKTDSEIATILGVSAPTVRFHLKRAGIKLGETGRLRTVQHAAALGYVRVRP